MANHNTRYRLSSPRKLQGDTRLTHRQRVLMYADMDSIIRWPSDDELRRLYAVLFHERDVKALNRFDARFDLEHLYPDPTPGLPTVSKKETKAFFNEIWKTVRRVNPSVKKVPSKENPMARFPYPGRKFYRTREPGAPSLTNYFYTADDGTVYFLKRSYLEDQPKKWLLRFAAKNKIFVTTPTMINGTVNDISLNGLVLQILEKPDHLKLLVEAMQKRKPSLATEDADAILSGEFITIDK